MDTKHTPGPWMAKPKNGGEWHVDSEDWGIAVVCGGAGLEGVNGHSDRNAALIAAAPEMFDALKEAQAALSDGAFEGPHVDAALRSINAAIAKAEGRS